MERFKFLATVNIILIKNKEILLARRFNTGYHDGDYEIPSGHIDGNETVRKAGSREALEELGIQIKLEDLTVAHVMHRYGEKNERIEFFLLAKDWEREPTNNEPELCDEVKWFPLDSLPSNIIPKAKFGIEQVLKANTFSEFDWK
ncbi:MAG: NUDIX hydrolase [Minisyncoccota bacterium]